MKSDRWEFPRHRLKFFNILGEGAFGQVWRCEAVDIDGTYIIRNIFCRTRTYEVYIRHISYKMYAHKFDNLNYLLEMEEF